MHRRYVEKAGLGHIERQADDRLAIGRYRDLPDLAAKESLAASACFIGPKGENAAHLADLAAHAMEHVLAYRSGFHPEDPKIRQDPGHLSSLAEMRGRFQELLEWMRQYATPFASMRYQAHMLSDNMLPGLAAYFASMMHNPNNVTIQASTETTLLEMLVMQDLCSMVGFDTSHPDRRPWSHITADGSVANLEGLWAAREAKLLPLAAKAAYGEAAPALPITLCDGSPSALGRASDWQLLNLTRDERLALPGRIAAHLRLDVKEVWPRVVACDLNARGWTAFRANNGGKIWPSVLIPSTAHYSWPKAAAVLGLPSDDRGAAGCVPGINHVEVDARARMNVAKLRARLEAALAAEQPVLAVVSVFGSTEESAVDPLTEILALRQSCRARGLDFDVHVDAAWGGYFVSTLRKEFALPKPGQVRSAGGDDLFIDDDSKVPLSAHVVAQAKSIRLADSVTIDPHKMGYLHYGNGSILYANESAINLTTFSGSYIGFADVPAVGLFGIEGSRPGAAAVALYFAHACMRPHHQGYGEMIDRTLHNAKQFYGRLQGLEVRDAWKVVTLDAAPAEWPTHEKEIVDRPLAEIRGKAKVMALYKELGPDQNLVDFGVNFRTAPGVFNRSTASYNRYVKEIYTAMSVAVDGQGRPSPISDMKFMVSMTTFDRKTYGDAFMDAFARRLGLEASGADPIDELNCLRSSVMSPFIADMEAVPSGWARIIAAMGQVISTVNAGRR